MLRSIRHSGLTACERMKLIGWGNLPLLTKHLNVCVCVRVCVYEELHVHMSVCLPFSTCCTTTTSLFFFPPELQYSVQIANDRYLTRQPMRLCSLGWSHYRHGKKNKQLVIEIYDLFILSFGTVEYI